LLNDKSAKDAIEALDIERKNEVAKPQEAIPIDVAQRLAKHGEHGRGRPKDLALQGLKYGTAEYWLLRLDRADPKDLALQGMTINQFADLATRVRAGKITANAAAIEAGFRKKPKQHRPRSTQAARIRE
jgi:hypothetical protein